MIRRPPRSTQSRSSAASDVYKRQVVLGGARQTIGAAAASPDDAAVLEVPVGSPVLCCRRVATSAEGVPVLLSEHVFPAHRTEFVVDLPRSERSMAPSGLRLVD